MPIPDGTVIIGDNCFKTLKVKADQIAAIAAVCAHEVGHLLQYKYVYSQLDVLRIRDRSVVRFELHADYVCGYYAAIRKLTQPYYEAVIHPLTQLNFEDDMFPNC